MLEAPRGLSHPQTSFIGTVCQGIHHTPFRAAHAPKNLIIASLRQTTDHHTVKKKMITKRSISKPDSKTEPGEIAIKQAGQQSCIARVHYPVLKPPRAPTGPGPRPTGPRRPARGIRKTARDQTSRVAVREPKSISAPLPQAPKGTREAHDLFHTSTPTPNREPFPAHGPHYGRRPAS